jgi:hypothetical protein
VELVVEGHDRQAIDEVDERIPHVAFVLSCVVCGVCACAVCACGSQASQRRESEAHERVTITLKSMGR